MKIQIFNDMYNISKRIKNIDRDYYVVFNISKQKFEVHNSNQIGSSYCVTIPYDKLDERALKFVLKTKSANIDDILEKIETTINCWETLVNSVFSTLKWRKYENY